MSETDREAGEPSAELLLRSVRSGNAFEETVQRLLQTIRLGLIAPGERLPAERELASMLSVSRDTLREAIASLADAGYLGSRRGRYGGTFVADVLPAAEPDGSASPDAATIEDTLVLRSILEVGAVGHAAVAQLRAGDRERLWQAAAECAAASADDYRRLDSRLHLLIAELAGAPSLVPLVADVRMRVNALLDRIPLIGPNIAHSNEQHSAIVRAILTGQADAAASAMREHLEGTEALLRGFLA